MTEILVGDLHYQVGSVHRRRIFEVVQDHRTPCYMCGDEDERREPDQFWNGLKLYREMEMEQYGVYWNPDLRF